MPKCLKKKNEIFKGEKKYDTFKEEIAKKRLELQLSLGKEKFEREFRFMTIIDKLAQIDEIIQNPSLFDKIRNFDIEDNL